MDDEDALDLILKTHAGQIGKHDDQLAVLLALPAPVGIGDTVRFDHSRSQWHIWNGVIWEPDRVLGILDLIRVRAGDWIMSDSLSNDDRKNIMPLLDVGKKMGVLKSLSAMKPIAMRGDEWDTDPEMMAFRNGVLNLRTGEFGPGKPSDLISRTTACDYRRDADPWLFYDFVLGIMGGDVDLAKYVVQVLGYSLIGWQREQKFWMLVGPGQNGKGVLTRTTSKALGTYASEPPDTLYMRTKAGSASSEKARPELLKLNGVRLTVMSEPQGGHFNEEMLKAHSGNDKIEARDLYAGARAIVAFYPTHTIIFLTNNPPRTEDVGPSMRRRARIIRFDQDYTDPKRNDPNVEDRLQEPAAMEGMMLLLTDAARSYFEQGLVEPERVTAWSNEYIDENDPLAQFVEQVCRIGPKEQGSAALLWAAYQDWASRNDVEPGSQMGFGLALSRKYKKGRSAANTVVYLGIKPKSAMDIAEDEVSE